MYDSIHWKPLDELNHDVQMIWHHAPGKQDVAFAVKEKEGVLDNLSDFGLPKPTFSLTLILIPLDSPMEFYH
jgi:hypothetical protein